MDERIELALWTAGSILLWIVGTQLAWWSAYRPQGRLGRFRTGWSGNPVGRGIVFLVRFTFYLGLPYIALLRHALSLVVAGLLGAETANLPWWTLGWKLSDWFEAVGLMWLGGIAAGPLVLGWWNVLRANLARPDGEFPARGLVPSPSILIVARESVFAEIHWAFYRAVPLVFISDPYWATLIGAALVLVEWLLNPTWWDGIRDGATREAQLMQIAWLALSSVVSVMTYNVWVSLFLHIVLAWSVGKWVNVLAAHPMHGKARGTGQVEA